jgi:hypothetical protein
LFSTHNYLRETLISIESGIAFIEQVYFLLSEIMFINGQGMLPESVKIDVVRYYSGLMSMRHNELILRYTPHSGTVQFWNI